MPPPYAVIPHPTVLGYMRGIPDLFIPDNLGLNPSGLVGLEVQTRFVMTGVSIATKQYIEQREGGYWIANKRISLDSLVYDFLNGTSPEEIASHFPLVTLEEVYGAIAFYLANREAIDLYLQEGEKQFEELRRSLRQKNPAFYRKLERAGL